MTYGVSHQIYPHFESVTFIAQFMIKKVADSGGSFQPES